MMQWLIVLSGFALVGLFAGCARFRSEPISPAYRAEEFWSRSLTNEGLREFLATYDMGGEWPRERWNLDALSLVAFYYHPDMDLARARWEAATAGKTTANQRPNPNLAFTPRINSSSIGSGLSPWILGGVLDIPIETMGKRKYRVANARHLDEMAKLELASAAWVVRSRVRTSALALQAAEETAALLLEESDMLGRVAELVEVQWDAGAVSAVEVSTARVAHQNSVFRLKDIQRQGADARGQLAMALGVPLTALQFVRFSFPDPASFPTNLTTAEVQRQAVLNRADVLSALAEYAASESALQLQIARQYPDIHLRPGYELDQNQNKWQVGVSMDLPILNQNQGPIAEAAAKRKEIAAKFDWVQASAIGEIQRASAVYFAALDQAATADDVLANLQRRLAAMTRMYDAGEVDKLVVSTAQAEHLNGALARLRACYQAQLALAALEDAVQAPLLMPLPLADLESATRKSSSSMKP